MNNQEYEQKKRECWGEFCKDNGIDQEVNISIFDAFNQIFDRAYALGREKETITQEEIEKAAGEAVRKEYLCEKCLWKDYCDFCGGQNSAYDCCECPADSFEDGFRAGANFALGKQEKDADDDNIIKVNKQLFCRMCADADEYINDNPMDDGSYEYYHGRSDALHELYAGEPKDADTVISGWVARDDGERWHERELHLFTRNKPERRKLMGDWIGRPSMTLDSTLFPDLTWESDPEPVEIIIKRKNK